MLNNPEEPICRYEAKFIAYGNLIYNITDQERLMEEVKKIDPNSLYGKDSQQIATDQIVEKIVPKKSSDLDTNNTTEEQISDETNNTSDTTVEEIQQNTEELPVTNPIENENITSTTTPEIILPNQTEETNAISTTTPEIILPDITEEGNIMSTTTPEITPTQSTSTRETLIE
jgi:hypothetical protein